MSQIGIDSKCLEFAEHIYPEGSPAQLDALAEHIQWQAELWIDALTELWQPQVVAVLDCDDMVDDSTI